MPKVKGQKNRNREELVKMWQERFERWTKQADGFHKKAVNALKMVERYSAKQTAEKTATSNPEQE